MKEEMTIWIEEIKKYTEMLCDQRDRGLCYRFMKDNMEFIEQVAQETQEAYIKREANLPKCITHGDMLQQNMMFDEKGNVTAIFDFDWVTRRVRLYDVAWMMHQSIATWNFDNPGWMDPNKVETFFRVYNKTILEEGARVGQLTDEECDFLPDMIRFLSIKILMDLISYPALTRDYSATAAYVEVWRYVKIIKKCEEQRDELVTIAKRTRL